MKHHKILVFSTIFLLTLSVVGFAGDDAKFGVVDFQQILQDSKSGQEIQNKIKLGGETLKSELQAKQAEIKELQEQYKREALILTSEQKAQKERELRAEVNEYRILQNQHAQEFNKLKAELINDVRKKIVAFAEKIGKSRGYLLIIEKQSGTILYAKDSLEITDQVMEEIDKQAASEKK